MTDAPDDLPSEIIDEPFETALSERYLAYALSTITQRALPDVRDGLKPVHRRLLYAMRLLRLDPEAGFKKCARVVGDVIGRFHPHGDVAVYDALVRLAQDFAVRYPLIEGQGNFGNVDGDNPAAMRYTEARLTEAARRLLADLDQDTVDFRETYDGEDEEPVVLPAAFPNLLANGAAGIAVGMATNIPPHNVYEICQAARALLKRPEIETAALLKHLPGPDLPTGGVCVEPPEAIAEAYKTGRGGFRIRAAWSVEETSRGGWRIIVTEIPYQVQKAKLIERIAALLEAKKLPLLGDLHDESAEDIRIVLEPRARTVDPELLMESLFKLTDLETRAPLNLNVLDPAGAPRVMGLKTVLRHWLDHRRVVVVRRARARLSKVDDRLEVLAGYLIVYLNIDRVIAIIREADEPKPDLMAEFALSDRQAEAVLNMRLRALRRLEEIALKEEQAALSNERDTLQTLLDTEADQWALVDGEIADLAKAYGPKTKLGRRRTRFAAAPAPEAAEALEAALVVREPVTVLLSEKGWIRALKGHGLDLAAVKHKEGDRHGFALEVETADKAILFATDGRAYTLDPAKLPGGRGFGEPVRLHVDLPEDAAAADLFKPVADRERLVAASDGRGFRALEMDMLAATRAGKQVLNLAGNAEAVTAAPVAGDRVAVLGANRKLLIFPLADLPQMSRGRGVKLLGGRAPELADVTVFSAEDGLFWTDGAGRRHAVIDWRLYEGARASAGKLAPKGFSKANRFTPRGAG